MRYPDIHWPIPGYNVVRHYNSMPINSRFNISDQESTNPAHIVSLALILIVNYYTAFLFASSVFYYLVLYIQETNNNKELKTIKGHAGKCLLKFAGGSLLAGGMAATTLLPTIMALSRTSVSGDVFPKSIDFFQPFIDFVSRLMTLAPLSIRDGMPNLYAGAILLIIIPFFFSSKRISYSTK